MKKLTKSAKQQFEERLTQLHVHHKFEMCPTEIYYQCVTGDGDFILLREQDGDYNELHYNQQYEHLLLGERFLEAMTERFIGNSVPIKPLFDWYASADHDDEPFNLLDIYMCDLEEGLSEFKDLYEEVAETKIITAREQWERDSAKAVTTQVTESGYTYRVVNTPNGLYFYVCTPEGKFFRRSSPPLDSLRKDAAFVVNYISHVNSTHPEDMEMALHWVAQGEYKMSECSLMDLYDIAYCVDNYEYTDIESSEAKDLLLHEEMNQLRASLVVRIAEKLEQGLNVNLEVLCQNNAIVWEDFTSVNCDDLNVFRIYFDSTANKYKYAYSDTSDGAEYSASLHCLSIETLYKVLTSIQ